MGEWVNGIRAGDILDLLFGQRYPNDVIIDHDHTIQESFRCRTPGRESVKPAVNSIIRRLVKISTKVFYHTSRRMEVCPEIAKTGLTDITLINISLACSIGKS